MKRLSVILILLFSCCLVVADDTVPALRVEHAWVREAPPSARVLAGYMTLVNASEKSVQITRVTSPDFASVELHRTVVEDGVARMLPIEQLDVPARGRQVLEPGGMHLMLINPHQPHRDGDSVILDIQHSDGNAIRISAPVLRKTGGAHHHHH